MRRAGAWGGLVIALVLGCVAATLSLWLVNTGEPTGVVQRVRLAPATAFAWGLGAALLVWVWAFRFDVADPPRRVLLTERADTTLHDHQLASLNRMLVAAEHGSRSSRRDLNRLLRNAARERLTANPGASLSQTLAQLCDDVDQGLDGPRVSRSQLDDYIEELREI